MLAEAYHSTADTGNELVLTFGNEKECASSMPR
jgi:hypothetical protein